MNKVKRRAMSALLVAVLVLGGIGVYIVRYIEHGAEWATFAANSSVYTSGVLSTGTLTDRSGVHRELRQEARLPRFPVAERYPDDGRQLHQGRVRQREPRMVGYRSV